MAPKTNSQGPGRIVALFDFDGTLFRDDSLAPFLLHAMKRHPKALRALPGLLLAAGPYLAGWVSKEQMKTLALRILAKVPREQRPQLVESFLAQVVRPRLFVEGLARLDWHRQQGHRTVLISASMDIYLEAVAKELGFEVLVCTQAQLEPSPRVLSKNCYHQEKIRRLKEFAWFEETDWTQSFAYSDHPADLPLLELVGHPTATGPTRELRRHATHLGWNIEDWS